jgi:(R,R)-butanediol dehydrogenase/meso-butanediol dehydrogenase/diacetyl reductase
LGTYCVERNGARFPGYAEYCVVDINQVFKIPKNEDLMRYALVEPMTCAIRGIDLADIKIGQNIAISGVGGIGLILLNMIMLQGGANVTAIDPIPHKRELALKMGAKYTIDPSNEDIESRASEITDGQGFDIVFEASGAPAAAPSCLKLLALRGTVVYFAVYPMDYELPVNLYDLYMTEGKIKTAYCDSNDITRAIQLVPRMSMDLIIGKTYPLNKIDDVFDAFKASIYPKILVEC